MGAYNNIIEAIQALLKVKEAVETDDEKDLINDMADCLREMRKEYLFSLS